jgi:L-fuconolactonase
MASPANPARATPIIDAHAHVFNRWPFSPEAPSADARGQVERLIHEMDENQVAQALVICALGPRSSDNNHYAAACGRRFRGRLLIFPSVDPYGSPTYHAPGAAGRLVSAAAEHEAQGILHVVGPDYTWLASAEGLSFLAEAERLQLMVSLPLTPAGLPTLATVARQVEGVTFLCHHLGGARVLRNHGSEALLTPLMAVAQIPNVWHKISGFHHISPTPWDFPHRDLLWIVRLLYDLVGPRKLCWGSDFPVVESAMTYRQSLEIIRRYCTFIPAADLPWILGGNLDCALNPIQMT